MTLQVNPIALGCMLVVAVGTLIYTYVTTRQQAQSHGYGSGSSQNYNYFDLPSETSSRTSLNTNDSGNFRSRKKKNIDHCAICLGNMKSALKTLTCNHVFHTHCITTWLHSNTTCPICRREAHI